MDSVEKLTIEENDFDILGIARGKVRDKSGEDKLERTFYLNGSH